MSVFHAKLADLLTVQSPASHLGHLASVKSAGANDCDLVDNEKGQNIFFSLAVITTTYQQDNQSADHCFMEITRPHLVLFACQQLSPMLMPCLPT